MHCLLPNTLEFESLCIAVKLEVEDAHVYLHELCPAQCIAVVCHGHKVKGKPGFFAWT